MKISTIPALFLALTSVVDAAPAPVLEERQSGLNMLLSGLTAFMPGLTAQVTTKSATIDKPDVMRHIVRYGPFVLPAYKEEVKKPDAADHEGMDMGGKGENEGGGAMEAGKSGLKGTLELLKGSKPMDPNGFGFVKKLTSGICKDCTVLKGRASVNFEDGKEAGVADGVYIHHAVVIDISKSPSNPIPGCGGIGGAFSTFLGAGVDNFTQMYTTPDASVPGGYYIKDDSFVMQAEFVNYKATNQSVYVQLDYEYMSGKTGGNAAQFVVSSTRCDNEQLSFTPTAGTAGELVSQEFPVMEDGTIVNQRGHMHDGGSAVEMRVNGKAVCTSDATYGGQGKTAVVDGKEWATITNMSTCFEPIEVKEGDKVVVAAKYDTVKHPTRISNGKAQEVMGLMTFTFVPKRESSSWGSSIANWMGW